MYLNTCQSVVLESRLTEIISGLHNPLITGSCLSISGPLLKLYAPVCLRLLFVLIYCVESARLINK